MIYPSFDRAVQKVAEQMQHGSYEVHTAKWQGSDVSKRPEARMREVLNISLQVYLRSMSLDHYRADIRPNLPWADDHFLERVGGLPLNPGVQWANWPWALSADKFRTEGQGKFTHTYMERYWPCYAELNLEETFGTLERNMGYRYEYGDLNDVIEHLGNDPDTRQAYFPIWFPEDTGVRHGGRVPCTLGHHFILRNGYFHHTYYIRSCDFFRHFRDDLYLSVRLHLWVLEKLQQRFDNWRSAQLGLFNFHCVSMHMFINDYRRLFGTDNPR